jgi:hypothetical protein
MYETVLYFAVHLGFKSIQTIGWDYMPPNVENVTGHFYPEKLRKKLKNPAALPFHGENIKSIKFSAKMNKWLSEKGINLSCYNSDNCHLSDCIERFSI